MTTYQYTNHDTYPSRQCKVQTPNNMIQANKILYTVCQCQMTETGLHTRTGNLSADIKPRNKLSASFALSASVNHGDEVQIRERGTGTTTWGTGEEVHVVRSIFENIQVWLLSWALNTRFTDHEGGTVPTKQSRSRSWHLAWTMYIYRICSNVFYICQSTHLKYNICWCRSTDRSSYWYLDRFIILPVAIDL